MTEERVQKILARAGYGSRRSCEVLITEGRVLVNGIRIELGAKADLAVDRITVDGTAIAKLPDLIYFAYNKPRFMLCDKTLAGDNRRTVFEAVPGGNEMSVVGRLDFESEGLIILTNDGDLVNKLTHPRYEHEKEYRVLLSTKPDNAQIETWRRGIVMEDGYRTAPVKINVESQAGKGTWLRIVMKEGRKRQIRETAKLLGLYVVKIVRTRIGSIVLGNLKSGEYRELSKDEVEALKKTSGATRARKTPNASKDRRVRRPISLRSEEGTRNARPSGIGTKNRAAQRPRSQQGGEPAQKKQRRQNRSGK